MALLLTRCIKIEGIFSLNEMMVMVPEPQQQTLSFCQQTHHEILAVNKLRQINKCLQVVLWSV